MGAGSTAARDPRAFEGRAGRAHKGGPPSQDAGATGPI